MIGCNTLFILFVARIVSYNTLVLNRKGKWKKIKNKKSLWWNLKLEKAPTCRTKTPKPRSRPDVTMQARRTELLVETGTRLFSLNCSLNDSVLIPSSASLAKMLRDVPTKSSEISVCKVLFLDVFPLLAFLFFCNAKTITWTQPYEDKNWMIRS